MAGAPGENQKYIGNLGEAEVLKLWDIVEIGLGGYVIGRSAEKILPGVVSSLQKK